MGENFHLNLDGILFLGKNCIQAGNNLTSFYWNFLLGGVKTTMWKELPQPLMSKFGFQGCLASLELNGEMVDPLKVKYFSDEFLIF